MQRPASATTIPVGFIAGGTGNSVLTSLGLTDTTAAARMVTAGKVRRFDLGSVEVTAPSPNRDTKHANRVYWLNLIGWGVAAEANTYAESCRCCGPLRYNVGGMMSVCQNKTRNVKLEVDGAVIEGPLDVVFVRPHPFSFSAVSVSVSGSVSVSVSVAPALC